MNEVEGDFEFVFKYYQDMDEILVIEKLLIFDICWKVVC